MEPIVSRTDPAASGTAVVRDVPIAVVGLSCRLPEASHPEAFRANFVLCGLAGK
ncbi:hypothetical protein [Streptomyces sp. AB3(2024)]|uniref:hypothetical protein n=1 Tax=Streptomyces sp. AB3(2024) TaxID=3317321 RepID=UPI0035A3C5E6